MKQTNNNQHLEALRHSCAHLLAAAVTALWPTAKRTIGPAIENGFYYDFDFETPIAESDLSRIEQKMHELVKSWDGFEKQEVTKEEALKLFHDNEYKKELIEEFAQTGATIILYKSGNFIDLCRGGHSGNPREKLKHFQLLSVAGAYWRGDKKNKMLTRIYGTCFASGDELERYLKQMEEAKKRDHRKLGQQLGLFTVSEEVGPGLILWLPKGNIIKETLEEWAKQTEEEWGYARVTTPHITKAGLYYTSGHLPYYKDDMYPSMQVDEHSEYYLKPMNCPHHHIIYKAEKKSYKDLPVRLAEYGTCYRYESSGELFGLMRVRGFSQNDAHIYCTVEQAVEEFAQVMRLHEYYYRSLGIHDYHLELALRDPKNKEKYLGSDEMWALAEQLMREAIAKTDITLVEEEGSAAFYGPKVDFIVRSSIGRSFAASTNQIDLFMAERFGLTYMDQNGTEQKPVIIHRAPLGSHERFIGFLIEHYGGAFPLWLSPIQVVVMPVSDKFADKAREAHDTLKKAGVRAHLDTDNKTLGAKIREWTLQKVPYLCIIGEKELERSGGSELFVSVRSREGTDKGMQKLNDFLQGIIESIEKKKTTE